MSARYEPGTVATISWDNASAAGRRNGISKPTTARAIRTEDGRWSLSTAWNSCLNDDVIADVRPLAVLDLDDDESVLTLANTVWAQSDVRTPASEFRDRLRGALRALVATPKLAEPTGLGAVIKDANGETWTRVVSNDRPWRYLRYERMWSDLDVVEVLSEGVKP